jgi:hypothetical protein
MRLTKQIYLFTLLLTTATSCFGLEYSLPPEKNYFSIALWRNRQQLTIEQQGYELQQDTVLKIDELILKGPLYTNGHHLRIDALQITFSDQGAIRGYKASAPAGAPAPKGPQGGSPPQAPSGVDGLQNPGAIVIYAARMVGDVVIDGTGQTGGRGGHGGDGGKGVDGSPGTRAAASCWSFFGFGHSGTDGGVGGQGGAGGQGGIGGRGGAPIPIGISSGDAIDKAQIQSKSGLPGDGGEPGRPGDPGSGGPGGGTDDIGCGWFWSAHAEGGNQGPPGPIQTATLGFGPQGLASKDPAEVIRTDLTELESARYAVADAGLEFHWARTFLFSVIDTIRQITARRDLDGTFGVKEMTTGENNGEVLQALLDQNSSEWIRQLIDIWQTLFIEPMQTQKRLSSVALNDAEGIAQHLVALLQVFTNHPKPAVADIQKTLDLVRSGLEAQFSSTLLTALEACKTFNLVKSHAPPSVLQLTNQYDVPLCNNEPDLKKMADIAKPIFLFRKIDPTIPDSMKPFYNSLAAIQTPKTPDFEPFQWLLPTAFANDFSVSPVENIDETPMGRVPPRNAWLIHGLGVWMGSPEIRRTSTPTEIREQLYDLQQALVRIRAR